MQIMTWQKSVILILRIDIGVSQVKRDKTNDTYFINGEHELATFAINRDAVSGIIKKLYFYDRCEEIPDNVFSGYNDVEEVFLDSSVRRVGRNAFADCKNLKSVVFSGPVVIESGAFRGCDSLEQVVFPEDVQVRDQAFSGCKNLKSVDFHGATYIDYSAFDYCPSLESVKMDRFVRFTHNDESPVFAKGCPNLKEIGFADGCDIIESFTTDWETRQVTHYDTMYMSVFVSENGTKAKHISDFANVPSVERERDVMYDFLEEYDSDFLDKSHDMKEIE